MADEIEGEIEVGWDAFASAVRAQKDDTDRAIRQRIAALTDEQADRFAERLHDLISDTYADPEIDVCSGTRAALVALLAPEAT